MPNSDLSPEQKVAKSLDDLRNALDMTYLPDSFIMGVVVAATPVVTEYYLKGQ